MLDLYQCVTRDLIPYYLRYNYHRLPQTTFRFQDTCVVLWNQKYIVLMGSVHQLYNLVPHILIGLERLDRESILLPKIFRSH